jgi:ElaB/YqjD/DUF883 family membrane-anchored ribosome-binding protein
VLRSPGPRQGRDKEAFMGQEGRLSEGERGSGAAEQLDRALQGTRDRVGRAVGTARKTARSVFSEARHGVDQVREQLGALRERAPDDLRAEARDLVRHHPGAAVLLAVGAGILLGWLLRGRE